MPPSALLIPSPYDSEARYSKKRSTEWTGYKVHLTETCDDDLPHLITDVETTPATTGDFAMTPVIPANLAKRDLLPAEQFLDAGYVTAEHLVSSQKDHQVALIGPVVGLAKTRLHYFLTAAALNPVAGRSMVRRHAP